MYHLRAGWLSLFLAFSTILVSPIVQAKENSLKKGKWALQFEIDRNFDLRGFSGQTLSVKKHTSDNSAYRLGFTVAFSEDETEYNRVFDDSIFTDGNRDVNTNTIEVSFQRIHYSDVSAPANLFYGFGLSGAYFHSKFEDQSRPSTVGDSYYSKGTTDAWLAGIAGILGGEYFFSKSVSLLGEYSTIISYRWGKTKYDQKYYSKGVLQSSRQTDEKSTSFRISAATVKLGLSFYF